ncbi:hypothetical protein AB0I28_16195 [Phytomonospora sp. NPDC050363]|uniref:hypothetical protein n=1 Tax=Phytomonospora sp. NPDC050363 TaxID=3155642 RepID=UPI003406BE90
MPERVNVRWLLAVLIVLGLVALVMPFLDPPPADVPPTLVGVADTEGPLVESVYPNADENVPDVATLRPQDWPTPENALAELSPLRIRQFTPAAGVSSGDVASREKAAALLTRDDAARVGAFVHRTIGGLPAIELAYGDGEKWKGVATYLFGTGLIIAVDCFLPDSADRAEVLSGCATALNHLTVLS